MAIGSRTKSLSAIETVTLMLILALTIIAITALILMCLCVKKILTKKTNNVIHISSDHSLKEKVLYEEIDSPNHLVAKYDLVLQENPAYSANNEILMDTNPVYEDCK